MAFIADPFQKLFDRSKRKEQYLENGANEEDDDDGGDLQALIDVGLKRKGFSKSRKEN